VSKEIKSPTAKRIFAKMNDPAYQLNRLAKAIHEDADQHGLWDDFREAMKKYADQPNYFRESITRYYATSVVAGEVSELRNAYENKKHYGEEAADVVIAILSTCAEVGIDIGAEVVSKMQINHERPHKHGKESCYEPTPL
jgi:NTP pyrophosphatase (non-canonical NTP hydrolase)